MSPASIPPRPARFVSPSIIRASALLCVVAIASAPSGESNAQSLVSQDPVTDQIDDGEPAVSEKVDVEPIADDQEIANRLRRILEATGWFADPSVSVDEGVVTLTGRVEDPQHKEWAGRLAGNTQDVVAVVNRMDVLQPSPWDLSPAWRELEELGAELVRSSPLILLGLLLLVFSWFATKWSVQGARVALRNRVKSRLLRDVAARAIAVPVFLFGLYLVLKVSGLTRLAVTVLGGTGLIGLVVGFAFRDIAENFLASILVSIQHPFASGDLIQVAGFKGYVQSVNTRSTLLMTLDGNHVQIPNATIYKETIINFTANPYVRFDFPIGIGYEDSIADAQSIALRVLREHPAVVDDPEPLVLVDSLGAATVNLRVFAWVDANRYSHLKVNSAVIRLTKAAFEEAGISMPDEAREVVFPRGVPVQMIDEGQSAATFEKPKRKRTDSDAQAAHMAEGELESEAAEIQQQASKSRIPEGGANLLET